MTPAEAQILLSMCATVDNRKPDADAAKAWAAMLGDLPIEDCRLAVIEHYRSSTDWLMPAQVRTIARRIRSKRIAEHPAVLPPADMADDPGREIEWRRELNRRIGSGETFDPNHFRGQLKQRDMRELTIEIPKPE